jgi:threonine synthase
MRVSAATSLICQLCGHEAPLAANFSPCPACASKGRQALLEVSYDYQRIKESGADFLQRATTFWDYAPLLPVQESAHQISLGEGNTPLVPSRSIQRRYGYANVFIKNETVNPTFSHKDRFQSVAISKGRELGCSRTVTSSTGNHGVSAAAYAAAADMACLVFYPPETSQSMLYLTAMHGARAVVTRWEAREAMVTHMVAERGWYPSVSYSPRPIYNPYGVEGYKTVAYELARQLDGVPDKVLVPVASGNILYGIWKGFRELHELGVVDRLPEIFACHASGANPLEVSFQQGLQEVVTLDAPFSIATSTMEKTAERHALASLYQSGGGVVSVADEEILQALFDLGREGILVEPSSALSVACAKRMIETGRLRETERVVCVVTSALAKWPEVLAEQAPKPYRIGPGIDHLEALLAKFES